MLILLLASILMHILPGLFQKLHSIRIQLAADAATTHTIGEAIENSLFVFSPSVNGKAVWLDARTIEFQT